MSDLLGDSFRGVVNCDRAKMYWSLPKLQWCWAHLKRDFQALIDTGDCQVETAGPRLDAGNTRIVSALGALPRRHAHASRLATFDATDPRQVDALLLRGACSGNARLTGMCDELWNHRDWLWTFVEIDGVEPTNNASERALRHAVIWRKLSFGTQSPRGSRFVETILTIIETCRQQSKRVFHYLTNALQASHAAKCAPSLLPGG